MSNVRKLMGSLVVNFAIRYASRSRAPIVGATRTRGRARNSPTNQLQGPTPPPTTRGLCPVELSCRARACLSPGHPCREAQSHLFSAFVDSKSNYKASMIVTERCANHDFLH